jgi:hypothetical protein
MPNEPDEPAISIMLACDLVGVSRQLRKSWITRHLIGGSTAGDCQLVEVLELAAFGHLVDRLGFEDARLVWPQVRDDFATHTGQTTVDVVVDLERKHAHLAAREDAIGPLVRHGRPTRVIALGEVLAAIEARCRELSIIMLATK